MNKSFRLQSALALIFPFQLVLALAGCHRASPEQMTINPQIVLTASGDKVEAYLISRPPGGDYYIAGSAHTVDGEAWAARLDSNGVTLWDFRYRPFEGKSDPIDTEGRKQRQSRFFGVATLADKSTLLCGIKNVDKEPTAFLVHLDVAGKLIEDRNLKPQEDGYAAGIICFNWGDGVALVGGFEHAGRPIGWLAKLDGSGTFMWEKFGRHYATGQFIVMPDDDLYTIASEDGNVEAIYRFSRDGAVVARHSIPDGEAYFVHPLAASSQIIIGVSLPTNHTVFLTYDCDLRGSLHSTTVENVGIKTGFELADGSLVVFGSAYHNGATANVARIYNNSMSTSFVVEPPYTSPWINDAIPGDAPNKFVTVRQLSDGNSVIAWVTFKAN